MIPKVQATVDELRKVLQYISKGYKVNQLIYDVIYEAARIEVEEKKKVVLIKRDPNVERDRIQAAYVKIIPGETLEICNHTVNGFGADFDGDSVSCSVTIVYKDIFTGEYDIFEGHIADFSRMVPCRPVKNYTRDDGVEVVDYETLDDVYCPSVNMTTGELELKAIKRWSVHKNIKLKEISSEKHNIKDLKVSLDHSLVVYDHVDNILKRMSIKEVSLDKARYSLVRSKKCTNVAIHNKEMVV